MLNAPHSRIQDCDLFTISFIISTKSICCKYKILSSERTRRSPRLLLRLSGVLLLRLAERQFLALLFQLPPRFTRLEPLPATTLCYQFHTFASEHLTLSMIYKSHKRNDMFLQRLFVPLARKKLLVIIYQFAAESLFAATRQQ